MSDKKSNIALVIMAAGASSRMGQPKQLLNWGDNSLISHSIKTAQNTNSKDIIVVLGANFDTIIKNIKHYKITVLNNKAWELGLGESIACAANYVLNLKTNIDGLLLVLADQPLIDSKHLNKMIQSFEVNTNQIIATSYGKEVTGVPVLFDSLYFETLSKLTGDEGAKSILKKYQKKVIALELEFENLDIDSKEDYNNLHKNNF